jgi:hypothetical protein
MGTQASTVRLTGTALRPGELARPALCRVRTAAVVIAVSVAVLVPCFWLPRIHAGDLSSHLYNAWLARLIREGQIEGLTVSWQWTNILFDLLLRGLLAIGGPRFAERVAVAAAALIFFWGAFALTSAVSRRRPWFLAPYLAGLAYGWTFHMGFFNFYLSLGLCCWALAFFWRSEGRSVWPWLFLAAGTLAHALPVMWTLGVGTYVFLARRIKPRWRWAAMAVVLGGIAAVRVVLQLTFETDWRFRQLASATGADQFWVYDRKYFPIFVAVLTLWGLRALRISAIRGKLRTALSIPFQISVLTAAGIFVLPHFVLLPGHSIAFQFIDERMSLAVAVLVCAALSASRPERWERVATAIAVAVFFGFLYADGARWDRIEEQMTRRLRGLPAGQRVVSQLCLADSRVNPLPHMVDRACIGWCFSYGNYEPVSGHFSVRVVGPNPVVAHTREQTWALETGQYIVEARDLPLYQIEWAPDGAGLQVRALKPGERAGQKCRAAVFN